MGAFYINSLADFINDSTEGIIGVLTYKSGVAGFREQMHKQTLSWKLEIEILKSSITKILDQEPDTANWSILLEYPITRREKRIDAVIIAGAVIIVIEFKIGNSTYNNIDEEQLLDYCLDLRDFHFETRNKIIAPILVASIADNKNSELDLSEPILPVLYANSESIAKTILQLYPLSIKGNAIDAIAWNDSQYSPTPTIIEAAQILFANKSVKEISRSHAGAKNLTKTTTSVIDAINNAKKNNEKIICFITGVPGAGKTLAGLNIAHYSEFQTSEESIATFLSGNGPLIKVLREALTRDAYKRLKKSDTNTKKREQRRVIAFIENVHRFIDSYFFDKEKQPNNKIVIFDEAQRAWNAQHSKRKFDRDFSEPEMMFEIMDRHQDWAVIVALIGGGQEINTGEAGLREWGNNLLEKYNHWKVHISPELKVGDHSTGNLTLFENVPKNIKLIENSNLHLDVSIRSYKAENISKWVQLVLDNNWEEANNILVSVLNNYQVVITRNLGSAREWLKSKCKGSRRMGLVASSGGRRLRPFGLDVKAELEEANWFLNSRGDVRSSYALEVPATEFGIQGLELDWVGVCWDLDLRRGKDGWNVKSFVGTKWQNVEANDRQQYVINKYRVLLTRAREGMIIFVPEGNQEDITRPPKEYDAIFEYLRSCGIPEI